MAQHTATLRALAVANARYWPTVAPEVRRALARWERGASEIPDPSLRVLALAKLAGEGFNAEVAATLATLAPRAGRRQTVRAIVALELLFDYLDGRTEQPCADPIAEGERLFAPFIAAVSSPAAGDEPMAGIDAREAPPDWGYLTALSKRTRDGLFALPAGSEVAATARASAKRCAQAQTRIHAAATLGERQLQGWAVKHAEGSGLDWREYAAGCASSVLAMHALIAAAADPATSRQDASRIDSAYLAICAAITILDSLVDRAEDRARGQPGFVGLYEDGELRARLPALIGEARARAEEAPHGDHHAMTLAGIVAYYTTHPGGRDPAVRDTVMAVRRELSPTIWPTIAVMAGWRAAKRARAITRPRRLQVSGRGSDTSGTERA
jgi:tetraprenyl-beta-curcumene synthase